MSNSDKSKGKGSKSDHFGKGLSLKAKQINAFYETDPDEATWQAILLCATVPKRAPSLAEREALSAGTPSTLQVDDAEIKLYTFVPAGNPAQAKTVIFTTGFGMTLSSMLPFVKPILGQGHRAILFDQISHGESTGPYWRVSTHMKTIELLARENVLAGVIGFSVGSTIASYVLWKNRIECPVLVCLNPPLQVITVMKAFLQRTGMNIALLDRAVEVARARDFVLVEHLVEEISNTSEGISARLLVSCDDNDKLTSSKDCRWLAQKLGAKEVLATKGLGHYGCLKDKQIVERVVEFLADTPAKNRIGKI